MHFFPILTWITSISLTCGGFVVVFVCNFSISRDFFWVFFLGLEVLMFFIFGSFFSNLLKV